MQGIRVEFGTAAGPSRRVTGIVNVQAGTLPVVVSGGPNGNSIGVNTTGAVTIDGGGGDDNLGVQAVSGTVAGGPGNDRVITRTVRDVASGLRISGGPGNDDLATDDHSIESFSPGPLSRNFLDCGPGADRVRVDPRDVLGPGCAPGVTGFRTAGRSAASIRRA